jgi:hypothetical protein
MCQEESGYFGGVYTASAADADDEIRSGGPPRLYTLSDAFDRQFRDRAIECPDAKAGLHQSIHQPAEFRIGTQPFIGDNQRATSESGGITREGMPQAGAKDQIARCTQRSEQ